jgi:hypothetical protein
MACFIFWGTSAWRTKPGFSNIVAEFDVRRSSPCRENDKQARKLKEELSWLDNLAEVSINGQPIVLCRDRELGSVFTLGPCIQSLYGIGQKCGGFGGVRSAPSVFGIPENS